MKNLKLLGLGSILFLEKVKSQHNVYIERFNERIYKSLFFFSFSKFRVIFNNKLLYYLFWYNTKNIIL
jgi:hypothetical protein